MHNYPIFVNKGTLVLSAFVSIIRLLMILSHDALSLTHLIFVSEFEVPAMNQNLWLRIMLYGITPPFVYSNLRTNYTSLKCIWLFFSSCKLVLSAPLLMSAEQNVAKRLQCYEDANVFLCVAKGTWIVRSVFELYPNCADEEIERQKYRFVPRSVHVHAHLRRKCLHPKNCLLLF